MAEFTTDQLVTFRRIYLRDYVDGATKLSDYNRSTGMQYLSDADLNAMKARVELDNESELSLLYRDHKGRRTEAGDSEADADTKAQSMRLEAVYRLVRAEVYELMLTDPFYRKTLPEGKDRIAFNTSLEKAVLRDRNFVRSRAGSFSSVDIVWK